MGAEGSGELKALATTYFFGNNASTSNQVLLLHTTSSHVTDDVSVDLGNGLDNNQL